MRVDTWYAVGMDTTDDLSWKLEARCLGSGLEFFDLHETYKAKLRATCASCTVSDQCLEFALFPLQPYGLWAGTTPGEREDMLAARGQAENRHERTA